jgi:hypothetical protein
MNEEQLKALLLATPEGQRALQAVKLSDSQGAAVRALTPTVQRGNPVTNIGGESIGGVSVVDTGLLETITVQYTAPTSGGKWVIIGNPGNIVSNKLGISSGDIAEFSGSGNTNSYSELQEYARGGFTIQTINYQVNSSTQFAQTVKQATVSLDGTVVSKPLNGRLVASLNPMDNLNTVRILNLSGGQAVINRENALLFFVAAGNTVTLAITPGGARS